MVNTRRSRKLVTANSGGLDVHTDEAQVPALATNGTQSANALVSEDAARGATADRALSRRESTESNGALSTDILIEDKPTSNGPRSIDEANKENSPSETSRGGRHPTSRGITKSTLQVSDQNPVPSVQDASPSGSQRTATSSTPPASKNPARKPGPKGRCSQKGRCKQAKGKSTITKSDKAKRAAAVSDTGKANDDTESPSIKGPGNKYAGTSIEDDAADLLILAAAAVLAGFRAPQTRLLDHSVASSGMNELGQARSTADSSETTTAPDVPLRRSRRDRKLTFKAKEAADVAESKAETKRMKVQKANEQKATAAKKRKHEEVNVDGDGVTVKPAQSKRGRIEEGTLEGRNMQDTASDLRPPQPTPPVITTGAMVADVTVHCYIQTSSLRATLQDDNYAEPSEDRAPLNSAC